jgi:hypothetical protein
MLELFSRLQFYNYHLLPLLKEKKISSKSNFHLWIDEELSLDSDLGKDPLLGLKSFYTQGICLQVVRSSRLAC